ncbi:hypothetical protein AB0284_21815 [Pseudarthrobacter phenanthrenivorans]|uniref:hypothetical protein n=1 Tax=Pseudarthrobacter phenanthrenivorans TaxID=361575 RepID=UPI0034500298
MKIDHIVANFRVNGRSELEQQLDSAVAEAVDLAIPQGSHGVLVTRHDFDRFSVALSPLVPFGQVYEYDLASRH